ncbi:hypothetical protein SAY86_027484 [Trapa natans]|uniref:Uncharacterized protein n=1 Tax=Trapa natans TaxID=22666 RepID=A0AAN7KQX1_TRANT|nr:hypothetical protein SAY86_027484 [Trapa natans]
MQASPRHLLSLDILACAHPPPSTKKKREEIAICLFLIYALCLRCSAQCDIRKGRPIGNCVLCCMDLKEQIPHCVKSATDLHLIPSMSGSLGKVVVWKENIQLIVNYPLVDQKKLSNLWSIIPFLRLDVQ